LPVPASLIKVEIRVSRSPQERVPRQRRERERIGAAWCGR